MAIDGPLGNQRFVSNYLNQFPPSALYGAVPQYAPQSRLYTVGTSCTPAFRTSRQTLMSTLLEGNPKHSMAEAFLSEYLIHIALQPVLENTSFCTQLAPQSLERSSTNHQGVDLLISDEENTLWLGIDAKLRSGKSAFERDGYGWNPEILTPYMYLSLGNWNGALKEMELPVRQWMTTHVVGGVNESKSIPGFGRFRQYLVERIERSLAVCRERVIDHDERPMYGAPESKEELDIFGDKIHMMHGLFTELRLNL